MILIGFGSYINHNEILTVQPYYYKGPIKRVVEDARDDKRLVDATKGHATATVIVTKTNHVVLSARSAESIIRRLAAARNEEPEVTD